MPVSKKLKIIKIDTITDQYVFKTKDELNNVVFIPAQKNKVEGCKPFKRFMIAHSAHIVYALK